MGRKKGRPVGQPLVQVLAMKGVPAWRTWLEEFANSRGSSSSETIDAGLEMLAKAESFRPAPPRTGEAPGGPPT